MFNLSGALHLRGSLPHMPHLGLPGQNSHCFKAFQARRCPLRCCQAFLGHHVCPHLLVRPRFCPSRAAGDWHCTLIIPTLVSGPPTCERCCSFVSLFFPSPLVAELKSEQLVPGVGHRHWELQHPLGETRSPPGRLPPASLAYVWLDHVPGETLASYSIFWGLHKYSPS